MVKERRPIGPKVAFRPVQAPVHKLMEGRYVRLEPLRPHQHGSAFWPQVAQTPELWDYLFEPPPPDAETLIADLQTAQDKPGWQGYAICFPDGAVVGYAFYLNIVSAQGTIEVGNINFAPVLQRTRAATEAMYLMMSHAFASGYRRYEWKCNALNMPSRRAAQRLGFSWEGIFRQHMVVKGRNRDTAWFAVTDQDWPRLQAAHNAWLAPENFDADAQQRRSLAGLTAPCRVATDPDLAP